MTEEATTNPNDLARTIVGHKIVSIQRLPDGENAYRYTLYVYAENKRIAAAVVEGDDGNGYYGTGYRIRLADA